MSSHSPSPESPPDDQKTILRQEARRHRARIDIRGEDPDALAGHFFQSIQIENDSIVSLYYPKPREIDIFSIAEKLWADGITCALPVVSKETKIMHFAPWTSDSDLTTGAYKVVHPVISEPPEGLEPDILLVPLLAYDRRGYRLGQGGGYYDATLNALRAKKEIQAVGIAYAQQACLFNLPVDDHDERLDWVITPKGATHFE